MMTRSGHYAEARSSHFSLRHPTRLAAVQVAMLLETVESHLQAVCALLHQPPPPSICVDVQPGDFPIPRTVFRGAAVTIAVDAAQVGGPSMVHEIVHAVHFNRNRFLAEGLAVYAAHALCGVRAWPFPGRSLAGSVSAFSDRLLPLAELLKETDTELRRFHPARASQLQSRVCYAQGGSFVAHLIERYGMASFDEIFRAFHRHHPEPEMWDTFFARCFGAPLPELEQAWLRTNRLPRAVPA